MHQTRLEQQWLDRIAIDPGKAADHLGLQATSGRRLKVHTLTANGSRHHLHGPIGIITPSTDLDPRKTCETRGEKRSVPCKQSFWSNWVAAVSGGVEHHRHDTLYMPIQRRQRANVHPKAAGDGRTHGVNIEVVAFDCARLDDVFGQRGERRSLAQRQPYIDQSAQQLTLRAAGVGQRSGQRGVIVTPIRPVLGLPDVGVFAALHAVIMSRIRRRSSSIC